MDQSLIRALITELSGHVTPERLALMQEIAAQRTDRCTIVLEDTYQTHNASAIVRSADGFGLRDIHLIQTRNQFSATHDISRGAEQWVNLKSHQSVGSCYQALKKAGYVILATTPADDAQSIDSISPDKKIAFVFGTEQQGLTDEAIALADYRVAIPMYGFTQSFNVSVSVGICVYTFVSKVRQQLDRSRWQLSEHEQEELVLQWLTTTVSGGTEIVRRFVSRSNYS